MAIFSPAKINLYLHVTGKHANGYHDLDSLIAFTDIGDEIDITPHDHFAFEITGPYGGYFTPEEKLHTPNSGNIIVRAAYTLAQHYDQKLNVKVTLTKNLPLAAGLGGGSANAAAVIWSLMKHWNLNVTPQELLPLMLDIGADVPVCYTCETARIKGIGEPDGLQYFIPEMPILIINPDRDCRTASIFKKLNLRDYASPITVPQDFSNDDEFIDFLKNTRNDLLEPAIEEVPEIANILQSLEKESGCLLARMSGSGASCYGLFDNRENANTAREHLQKENPDWWMKSGQIICAGRY